MTTEREMLEFTAKACGYILGDGWHECTEDNGIVINGTGRGDGAFWNPLSDSADCAAMCAKLLIDWINSIDSVIAVSAECDYETSISRFINDREAAWRYAATMVGALIGGYKK